MIPKSFAESNKTLLPPAGMDNCDELQVWTGDGLCLSCWQPSWRERLSMLFFGRVWIYVYSGATQPPIALAGKRTAFERSHA